MSAAAAAAIVALALGGRLWGDAFTVVAIPDSQHYASHDPVTNLNIDGLQTTWIAAQAAGRNIKYVVHLGDLVDDATDANQWAVARAAMDRLDAAGIPYGIAIGNHDELHNGVQGRVERANFFANFSPSRYEGKPWRGGSSLSGLSNYQVIPAGGRTFLFLNLCLDLPPAEVDWAQGVLDANRDKPTVMSTHRYLQDYRLPQLSGRYRSLDVGALEQRYDPDAQTGETVFQNFVRKNRNIFMVLCGHGDGELRQTSVNDAGLPVFELLSDYQDFSPYGGNGWMRLMTFDTDAKTVQVRTYSPLLQRYRAPGEGMREFLTWLGKAANRSFLVANLAPPLGTTEAQANALMDGLTADNGERLYRTAYASGQRDSEFTLSVDFDAYATPKPSAKHLLLAGVGAASVLALAGLGAVLILRRRLRAFTGKNGARSAS